MGVDGSMQGATRPRKGDLYRVNEWAAGIFRKLFATPHAAAARAYVRKRGVRAETAETFRLGYSPTEWDGLIRRARRKGIDDKLLCEAGLAFERRDGTGYYDRFRGRLMFPITEGQSRVIGFGARALGDEEPKYVNTVETAVFRKGGILYGLDRALNEIEKTRTVYLVEGYFDVILPYQAGMRGLVATLGTALTRDQLSLLRRARKVVFVLDGDDCGQVATKRGIAMVRAANMDARAVLLAENEDPCDVVARQGADGFRKCLARSLAIPRAGET